MTEEQMVARAIEESNVTKAIEDSKQPQYVPPQQPVYPNLENNNAINDIGTEDGGSEMDKEIKQDKNH